MQKRAAELLSELENVLCPIVSTPLFCFQAATRAEGTISSISHLAGSKSEWVGFSFSYKWGTGSRMSSHWDWELDTRKDLRVWPWNKVQASLLGSYRVQRENPLPWLRDALTSFCPCIFPNMDFSLRICVFPCPCWTAGQGSLHSFKPLSCPCAKS